MLRIKIKSIILLFVYIAFISAANVLRTNIVQKAEDINLMDLEDMSADCKYSGGECVTEKGKAARKCPPEYGYWDGTCTECKCGEKEKGCSFEDGAKICVCEEGYADKQGTCTELCTEDTDCKYGGTCGNEVNGKKFCVCKQGLEGDKCDIIADCNGKYKHCTGENGKCTYDTHQEKAVCKCHDNKKLDDKENICKECKCGEKEKGCSFEDGAKFCFCEEGYADKQGICTELCTEDTDCKYGGTCGNEVNGKKFCVCKQGLEGDKCDIIADCNGKYKHCTGENGKCTYDTHQEKAVCKCHDNKKLDDKENICKECKCGEKEKGCSFEDGAKFCFCEEGYADKQGICTETCKVDEECENGGVCEEKDGNKFCSCRPGVEGVKCETVIDCESGIYKDCKGDAGRCSFDPQTNAAVCECSGNKKLNDLMHICEECDCGEKGACSIVNGLKRCTCQEGYTDGDGICKECDCGEKGTCTFINGLKWCACDKGHTEVDGICKECDCGEKGACSFINGLKRCNCENGYIEANGVCKECDCGEKGACSFINDLKRCNCENGYVEANGVCKDCDCGKYSHSCYLDTMDRKLCLCHFGYVQINGYCYEDYTTSTATTKQETSSEKTSSTTTGPTPTLPTSTPRSCECGRYSRSCRFDYFGRQVCECYPGYVQINNHCYEESTTAVSTTELRSTAEFSTTPKNCYCGINSRSCRLNWFGRKMCDCYHGYEQVGGYCLARTTTERPVTTERDCYCGENSHSCNFDWFGRKVCNCRYGYVQMDGYCSEICNDDKCLYGKCQVMGYGYECRCYEGYAGSRCEKKIQPELGNQTLRWVILVSLIAAKWSLQKHFNEDSSTPAADMNSTVKVLLLIVYVLMYVSIAHCASVSKNNIEENQTDIHSIHSNYQLAACKCTGGKCITENGKKVCKCPPGYGDAGGICKACECGEGSNCTFTCNGWFCFNQTKKCICKEGYEEISGKCVVCKSCGEHETCYFEDSVKKCKCSEGYANDKGTCKRVVGYKFETVVGCISGIYKDCRNNAGTCSFDLQTNAAVCECSDNKKLNDLKHICEECVCDGDRECSFYGGEKQCTCKNGYAEDEGICKKTCVSNAECENGGACEEKDGNKFCSCKSGVEGDRCETVVACKSGIYKDCKDEAGTCSFDLETNAAECKCSDNKKLNDLKHICEECVCDGDRECSFYGGEKQCTCKNGYAEDEGICKKTCVSNAECENGGACEEKDGNKFCSCKSGVEGDRCETVVACKSGIYKDCKDEAGTCSFDLETNAAECKCSDNKKLNDLKHICEECVCDGDRECSFNGGEKQCTCKNGYAEDEGICKKTCVSNAECENGGACEEKDGNKFCSCKSGVEGDRCETVVACKSGIYKDCKDEAGTCSFDLETNAAECKCSDNKKLNDLKHICEGGTKICSCKTGYVKVDGICRSCDCGKYSHYCYLDTMDRKLCLCNFGYVQINGYCYEDHATSTVTTKQEVTSEKSCDCGKYSYYCYLDTMDRKLCLCHFGYVQINGYCYEDYTTSTVTTIQEVTSEKSCDCGKYSHSCYVDTMDRKLCLCHFGYVQMNGYCYDVTTTSVVTIEEPRTTTPTTTLRDCYCGINSRSCRLNWFGRKICDCYHGYEQVGGYCLARTTTERPVTTEREICNDDKCLYGKCQIMGYGYECRCYEGYTGSRCEKKIQPELGNQTLRWVIQVSLTAAVLIVLIGMFCFWCRMKK
ncbi:uncharacterized protein CDAR_119661 [Caerostris darwini]|uniref:EGF-like domain-containing protein n=1 Tax=Caerostris darwini TaxID=1538125 RepID=A0AAV4SD29_9ARAC|nr:uncharacterized protein CDAR_119661 [Caerostris darwini]